MKTLQKDSREKETAEHSRGTDREAALTTAPRRWRRVVVPLALCMPFVALLLMPWKASVGNYGSLVTVPGQEAIIRAPEDARLIELKANPGGRVGAGAVLGRMRSIQLDEQMVQVRTELARLSLEHDRLLGELRAKGEAEERAQLQLSQRRQEWRESEAEQDQIRARRLVEAKGETGRFVLASFDGKKAAAVAVYPAAIAALQSDADSRRTRLEEAERQLLRSRQLFEEGLLPRSEAEASETRVASLAAELAGAEERLEAALIGHRRRHLRTSTEMRVAHTNATAERLQIGKLEAQLQAIRRLIDTLEEQRSLLERRREQSELLTRQGGTVFGEDLPRRIGHFFKKGEEICRIADTRLLLLRVQVPEREIGDVRVGNPVRLKVPAFPDRIFRGVVSKIGVEGELNQYQQATYRVELRIENEDESLRPGMAAFARVDFDRWLVASILLYKVKQALRPELWML